MPEQVFFSDSAVRVTSTEATFGQMRLPLSEVESAKVVALPPRRNYVCNIGLALIVLACFFSTIMRWFPASGDFNTSYVLLDLSRVLMWFVGIGSLLWWLTGTRFLVKVKGGFGEKTVVVARRLRYARQVAGAVNSAARIGAASPGQVRNNAHG
jgi:hypothetical protein